MSEIKPGDVIEDRLSGVRGLCTARTDYLFSSAQIQLTPESPGTMPSSQWLEEKRVAKIEPALGGTQ